jgi:ABC-type nitrate/sulfonate/bicarbonate transport system substrate-binding protein
MQGLSAGRWDVAITAFDNLLASATREAVQSVAFATVDVTDVSLLVRPEIRAYDDLRGRPLAVDAVDTTFALVLRKLLLAHGLDLDRGDYTLVVVGGPQRRLDSLARGETFAALLGTGSEAAVPGAGLRALGHHGEMLSEYPGLQLAARADWLAANRDRAVRFLRAWQRGADWAIDPANRQAARELLTSTPGLSSAAAERALSLLRVDLRLEPTGLAGVRDLRVEFGYLPPPGPPIEPFYDASLYEQARQ